ncbi:MAG: TIM barrel protein [Gammaproteobacteria bacterium]|nr:TIM barrel protein [Gammaproteobacteria bacterium]
MAFSANLGLLWQDRALPDAIRAAGAAGFDAVECHWPFAVSTDDVNKALNETGLPMLCLNTAPGDLASGDFGLAALPGRETQARGAIDQAIAYAHQVKAAKIHVMAGKAQGDKAHRTFVGNLRYALAHAAPRGIAVLIEPLNRFDAPGYFLQTTSQAQGIIDEIGEPGLQLMFDCYHVQIMEGDITRRLRTLMPIIGHVQVASVPDRSEPDRGELDYRHVFGVLQALGYRAPIGAEYRPATTTDAGLGWLRVMGGP